MLKANDYEIKLVLDGGLFWNSVYNRQTFLSTFFIFSHSFPYHIAQLVANNLGFFVLIISFRNTLPWEYTKTICTSILTVPHSRCSSSSQLTPTSAWLDWHLSIIFAPELTVIFACLQEYIDMRMYEDHLYINFDKTSGTMPSKSGSSNPRESAMWRYKSNHQRLLFTRE